MIGLTGSVSDADIEHCQQVGMVEVLTKPVKLEDLVRLHDKMKDSALVFPAYIARMPTHKISTFTGRRFAQFCKSSGAVRVFY